MDTILRLDDFKRICIESNLNITIELLKLCPSRLPTFLAALHFLDREKPKVLIETGTARGRFDINLPSIVGDGASTLILALWCAANNAKLYTIDIDQRCIDNAKRNIEALGLSDCVEFITSDSIKFLQQFPENDLKFFYLDSYDFDVNNPFPSQFHHLGEYLAVKD